MSKVAQTESSNSCMGALKLNHFLGKTNPVFAVVVTLKLTCAEVPGETVTELSGSMQLAPVGTPLHASVTFIESALVDPPTASTSNANSALDPAVTVWLDDPPLGMTNWKSSAVPKRLTLCGLSPALSLTINVAVRVPPEVGVKVTLSVQLPPG